LGIATLEGLLTADPSFEQADILIVLNHLRTRNGDAAVEAAQAYQQRNPESTTSYNLLGRAYLAAERSDDARQAFEKAVELRPDDPGGNVSLAEFKLAAKDFEGARKHYARVLEKNPDHMQTLMKVAASYALEGREEEMFASLDKTIEAHPRAMEPHLIKARYHIAKGNLEKANGEFNALTPEQKEHPDALVTMAGMELAADEHNQAHHTIEQLIRLRPNVSQYHYMRAKALAGAGDRDNFTLALERAVELDPDHFYAKLALARLSLMTGDSENPDVMKLEVASADLRGDDEYAGHLLQTLYDQSPTVNNVIPLASHFEKMSDAPAAIELLQKWSAEFGDNFQVSTKLAQLYGDMNDIDNAIVEYESILAQDNSNIVALNNLAWYLLEIDAQASLAHAERAFGISPDSSSVLDTLAMAQLKTGRLVEARRTIDRALAESPDSPDMQFHEAQIRAQEGDRAGAIKELTRLLAEHEAFFERDKAAAFLRSLSK
jgi:putative PEP-CTERM system TPR-repeat lipoprotein